MEDATLFTANNLIFVSQHGGIVGSLYFRAEENGKIYRGRIRLVHEHGPKVSSRMVKNWTLISCSAESFGDLVPNDKYKGVLTNAEGTTVHESYTDGETFKEHTHNSRGKLVQNPGSKLTDSQIQAILGATASNETIRDLVNGGSFPAWIKQ